MSDQTKPGAIPEEVKEKQPNPEEQSREVSGGMDFHLNLVKRVTQQNVAAGRESRADQRVMTNT